MAQMSFLRPVALCLYSVLWHACYRMPLRLRRSIRSHPATFLRAFQDRHLAKTAVALCLHSTCGTKKVLHGVYLAFMAQKSKDQHPSVERRLPTRLLQNAVAATQIHKEPPGNISPRLSRQAPSQDSCGTLFA